MTSPLRDQNRSTSPASKRYSLYGLFIAWTILVFVPLGYLMAAHWIALPVSEERIEIPMSDAGDLSSWKILHVLGEECRCSRDVLVYLKERGASTEAHETVLLLGGTEATQRSLEEVGFSVVLSDAEDLCEAYGSEGVPFFQVTDESDVMRYSGSYSDLGYGATRGYLDLRNLSLAKRGIDTPNLPVKGCATSRRLQGLLDPFALKYN